MAGLTQPLEFRKYIRTAPKPGFDTVPFLDAIFIAFFVALNSSAFVLVPGAAVQLPQSSSLESSRAVPTAVLTVDRNELYFFEGQKLARISLESRLREFIMGLTPDDSSEGTVLLIKADASIPSSSLFNLMDTARSAGFTRIHLAAELNQNQETAWEE